MDEDFLVDTYVKAVMSPTIVTDCEMEEDFAQDVLKRGAGEAIAAALERPGVVSECNTSTIFSRPMDENTRQLAATLPTEIGNRMYSSPVDLRARQTTQGLPYSLCYLCNCGGVG